jgi:radical SAM superfamily enzyme YgiQ (UPF0313 family)
VVLNYLTHRGEIEAPIKGDSMMSWASAPKLNGIYLLNYLQQHDFDVELINSFYEQKDEFQRLLERSPRAVVISTTFMVGKQILKKLVDDIRELAPDIFIFAGGPFVYLSYLMLQRLHDANYDTDSAKDDFLFLANDYEPDIDRYIISLRGEKILCETLTKIKAGQSVDDLPNLAYLDGNTYHFSRQMVDVTSADDISIDWKSLPDSIFKSGVVPIQASIGCPYDCAFCNFTKDHRLTYIKPLDQLVNELRAVSQRGIRYVWFVDDNFRLGKRDLNAVCQRFVDEDIDMQWMTFIRASGLQDIDIDLVRRAGCVEFQLGLESADPKMLEHMKKQSNPELYHEVLKRSLAGGINCSCYFIFGFPGETDETVHRTVEFIKNNQFPELKGNLAWSIYPFILSPLSPIYEPAMRKKYELTGYLNNWKHRTMNSEQAKEHILKTFFKIDNSGPIYRGDNQDIFYQLGPKLRKEFEVVRHRLSKAAASGHLKQSDILQSFSQLLST